METWLVDVTEVYADGHTEEDTLHIRASSSARAIAATMRARWGAPGHGEIVSITISASVES